MTFKPLIFTASLLGALAMAPVALAQHHGGPGDHGGGFDRGGHGYDHGGYDRGGYGGPARGYYDGGHNWHWYAGYGPGYYYPPAYYVPPPIYYAPSPYYYAPPLVTIVP
jgi:hypothetical protein